MSEQINEPATLEIEPSETEIQAVTEGEAAQPEQVDPPAEKKPVTGGFQKRISKLLREKHEYAAQLEAERKAREQLEQRLQQVTPQDAPQEKQYETYEEYLAAKARHEARLAYQEARAEEMRREQESKAERERTQMVTGFRASVEQAAHELPDYQDVAGSVEFDPVIGNALLSNEHGAQILYYLGKNPDVLDEISSRVEGSANKFARAVVELTRLEAKALQLIESRAKSKAPPVVKPVSASGGQSSGPSNRMTADEWRRAREAQIRQRAQR